MKKYLLIAGLTLGLSGIGAMAQTSTTPGVPSSNDNNYPNAQASETQNTPDRDHDRTYSDQQDQQQYPDVSRHHRRDDDTKTDQNGQYSQNDQDSDQSSQSDRSYQSSQGWDHDRDAQNNTYDHDRANSQQGDQDWQRQDRSDQTWQNNDQYPHAGDQDRDRTNQGYIGSDSDNDQMAGGDLQSALQQSNLGNVSVRSNDRRIVLDGRVNSEREHQEALRIAQSYANGRKVVDRLQVSDQGVDRDDDR